jgi:protein involved in polysaccharide export with SLBB domain
MRIACFASSVVCFVLIPAALSQQSQLSVPSTTATGNGGAERTLQNMPSSLSANRIIALLHEKPELIIELKKVLADYLQQKGIVVQPDSITDEMLFSNIGASSELRDTITNWLRARGYASSTEIESLSMSKDMEDDSTEGRPQSSQELPSLTSAPEFLTRSAALYGLEKKQNPENTITESREAEKPVRQSIVKTPLQTQDRADASMDTIEVLHQAAPYNLQSLRDLYTQVPEQSAKLKRFGSNMFVSRGLATKEIPLDLPIGPDYVLGPGDGITINLWGGVSENFIRTVDREGKVALPEAGSIVIAGLTLERAEALIQGELSQQFKNARVAVSVTKLRTVRVYVVGDVQRPGAYDISSLSTPLNALYAAGGPTSIGSLRIVRHYRGKNLIRTVDLYDFLLHGVRADAELLESGDTILVPAAGPQVAIAGMVKRPAIYELNGETKLSEVIDEAGGLRVTAALTHITIERVETQGHRETLNLNLPVDSTVESARREFNAFAIRDGDRIIVAPILPYSEKSIYVEGHVVRPGRYPYRESMKLDDVIHSYQDLLPEPSDHGEIIRLMPPDLRPEAIDFIVSDVLVGNEQIHLQPFDTIRILGRYETDAPKVTVRGEVLRPGDYALSQGMTAAQLVRIAGGFKRSALLDDADLASYEVREGKQVISQRSIVRIGAAVQHPESGADVLLKSGDILTVHQLSGWNDIGASVTLAGEVTYPGTYGLQEGEKLSSVIQRAGGFRSTAYPAGAVLARIQVRELEEKSRAELIHQIERTSAAARLASNASGQDQTGTLQLLAQQQDQVLQRLRSQPAEGRLVIKISSDIGTWADTPADIELRSGDELTIPKKPSFVLVSGQVYNTSAITFVPGKNAGWYLSHAGGSTDLANRKEIFVIRANGVVVGRRSGEWYGGNVLSTRLDPGDIVVVPQKIIGGSMLWKNMLATAQVASSIAFTAALALR